MMLSVLGLNELQELVYRQLIVLPSATAAQLAETLGRGTGELASTLKSLEAIGLAARSVADAQHYIASPPQLALGSLIVEQQQDIRRAELELHTLNEQFQQAAASRAGVDVIDVVRGPQAVAQHFTALQRGAQHRVRAMVKANTMVMEHTENVDESAAAARGVKYQVIIEAQAFNKPGFAKQAALTAQSGEEIRVAPSLPMRMLIADDELALLPLHSESVADAEIGALLIRPSGLLDALLALYDLAWDKAEPTYLPGGAPTQLDEIDQHLLVLLRAGITDQAIAGQLSMSLRTVQRRLQQLMALAEASTRFQLGVAAALKGWIES